MRLSTHIEHYIGFSISSFSHLLNKCSSASIMVDNLTMREGVEYNKSCLYQRKSGNFLYYCLFDYDKLPYNLLKNRYLNLLGANLVSTSANFTRLWSHTSLSLKNFMNRSEKKTFPLLLPPHLSLKLKQ